MLKKFWVKKKYSSEYSIDLDLIRNFPDFFSIEFSSMQKEVLLILTNILGKEIYFKQLYRNTSKERISLDNFPKGSYILIVEFERERYSKVVIFQ